MIIDDQIMSNCDVFKFRFFLSIKVSIIDFFYKNYYLLFKLKFVFIDNINLNYKLKNE